MDIAELLLTRKRQICTFCGKPKTYMVEKFRTSLHLLINLTTFKMGYHMLDLTLV